MQWTFNSFLSQRLYRVTIMEQRALLRNMNRRAFLVVAMLSISAVHAQNVAWGWGAEIYVNQIGSTITCTVYDPVLDMTRTQSFASIGNWINDDGVVATVSMIGTVQGIVYDSDLGEFRVGQLSSISGTTLTNSDGVVAWVTASGTVGAAIYDPFHHQWRVQQFSSNSGNQMLNRDGVVSWVSAAGALGAAVYDPALNAWRWEQLNTSPGNTMRNGDGVVAWVSAAGAVGAALYDPSIHAWRIGQFSSNAGNAIVLGQGVVAWKSTAGKLGAAAYDFEADEWDSGQFSTVPSNSMPTVTSGTVQWTNSNGPQRYGYTSAHQWQNNVYTAVQCEYHPINVSGTAQPHIVYLWCLGIGATSYSHQCGDGHTVTRRWAWKSYPDNGSYLPTLNVSGANGSSTCSGEPELISTEIAAASARSSLKAFFLEGALQIQNDLPLGAVEVFDASGRDVAGIVTNSPTCVLPGPFASGVYAIRSGASGSVTTLRVGNAY